MTDREIKPLPWYRAIVTRTPAGRKHRRRLVVALLVLCSPWLAPLALGFGVWRVPAPAPLTPAERTELARREAERYYLKKGCEREGIRTWICPNPDAGVTVADCREQLKGVGYDLDAGDSPVEMKCGTPQNREKKDATKAPQ